MSRPKKGTVRAAGAVPTATVTAPDDELISWLVGKLGLPRNEVLDEIEAAAARNPVFRNRLNQLRDFMAKCYDFLAGNTVEGFAEVVQLLKTGSGPVVPDDVDLA